MRSIESALGLISVSSSDQPVDTAPSWSDDDGQVPTGGCLSNETVAALLCRGDEGLAKYDLLNLHAGVVAHDVLFPVRLDNELINSHMQSSFGGNCMTKDVTGFWVSGSAARSVDR